MSNKPSYTVFAGINGAGKSTLYDTIGDKIDELGIRINPDEIAKELGDFNSLKIQIQAGKIAVNKIKECRDKKVNFNQETTLTGKSVLNQMSELKKLGYNINLYYIGLSSKELAYERVLNRVKNGGHNIPKDVVFKRYQESIDNLSKAIELADNVKVFDNSTDNRRMLFKATNNELVYKNEDIPKWFEPILEKYLNKNITHEKELDKTKKIEAPNKDDDFMKEYLEKQKRRSISRNRNKNKEIER